VSLTAPTIRRAGWKSPRLWLAVTIVGLILLAAVWLLTSQRFVVTHIFQVQTVYDFLGATGEVAGPSGAKFVGAFLQYGFRTYLASFGWGNLETYAWLYWLWGPGAGLAVVGLLVRVVRRTPNVRWSVLGLLTLHVLSVITLDLALALALDNIFIGAGRYLLLSLPAVAVLLVSGRASFEILWVRHSVAFRATFGRDGPARARPAVDIAALVAASLGERGNWSAQAPPDGHPLVSLRRLEPGEAVLAHPASALTVRQRLVPLGVEIARFGGVAPAGARRVAIERMEIAGRAVGTAPVREAFAPGQFLEMTDEEKLSAPSFERYHAGAMAAGEALSMGVGREAPFDYETIYVTPPAAAPPADAARYAVPAERLPWQTRLGAAGRSALRTTGVRKYRAPGRGVEVAEAAFAVVDEATLRPAGEATEPATRLSYLEAVATRRALAASHAARGAGLAVVSTATITTP